MAEAALAAAAVARVLHVLLSYLQFMCRQCTQANPSPNPSPCTSAPSLRHWQTPLETPLALAWHDAVATLQKCKWSRCMERAAAVAVAVAVGSMMMRARTSN